MTLEIVRYFCETCKAGPWADGAKGSGGKDIINTHLQQGHRIVEYDRMKHGDILGDSINAMMITLENSTAKRKDERDERIKKFGTPIKQIEQYLETQIKDDPQIIKQLLRVYFSAYTNNPINMGVLAPSSEGKTYGTVQVSKLFPKEDVILVGRLSPTALIHQQGIFVDENGNSIEERLKELDRDLVEASKAGQKERVEELKNEQKELFLNAKNMVDLSNKILLFLDNPNPQTYEMLKPILSHDNDEIIYKTTKGDGSLKVKETIIRGWPATIVCSAKNEAKNEVWPEIETRFFMTSPNTNPTKYKKANKHTSQKMGLPQWAKSIYNDSNEKKWARLHVNEIINKLKERKEFWSPLHDFVAEIFPSNQGVTMRHISRLLSFCNVESMINADNRAYMIFKTKEDKVVKTYLGTLGDLINTIDVLGNISTVPPEKLKFYDNVFLPLFHEINTIQNDLTETQKSILERKGVLSSDLVDKYTAVFKKPITLKQVSENYLKPLVDEGMIQTEQDPDNKVRHIYFPSNGVTIHNLETLKSTIIDKSTIGKDLRDAVISRLKEFIQLSIDFRKSNVIFYKDGLLNLDGLCSEINRQYEGQESL